MAEKTSEKLEREYIIPLRREWHRVQAYERTGRAIKAIKKFIAKHMKVQDRDLSKVKLDVYLNNELWYRGRKNPPAKIKVRATKEGDIVKVNFVEIPQHVKFLKAKDEKRHKKAEETKPAEKPEVKPEEKAEEKTEEQKKDEKEKETSTEIQHVKEAKEDAKAQKHMPKLDNKKSQPQRMALRK